MTGAQWSEDADPFVLFLIFFTFLSFLYFPNFPNMIFKNCFISEIIIFIPNTEGYSIKSPSFYPVLFPRGSFNYLFVYLFIYIYFMCVMSVLTACASMYHVHAWYLLRSEEDTDPLELQLWLAVTHYVGAGNWTQVQRKVLMASSLPAIPVTLCISKHWSVYTLLKAFLIQIPFYTNSSAIFLHTHILLFTFQRRRHTLASFFLPTFKQGHTWFF